MLQRRGIALAQPVHVDDGAEVVQLSDRAGSRFKKILILIQFRLCHLVVPGEGHGLPDVTLHGLAIAHEAVGAVVGLVQDLAAVGHAARHGQALK